jgi:hypothetical protein
MNLVVRILSWGPMMVLGNRLYRNLLQRGYIGAFDRYESTRPADVFLFSGLCGWTIAVSLLVSFLVYLYINAGTVLMVVFVALVTVRYGISWLGIRLLDQFIRPPRF